MNQKGKRAFKTMGVAIVIFIVCASLSVSYGIQEGISFKTNFGYDIQTVKMATTFENMKVTLINIRTTIGSVIPGDPNDMFNTIIPWARTPDNSLQMSIRAINLCIERLDLSMAYYKNYRQNTSAALVNDWYSTTVNNIKDGWSNTNTFGNIESVYTIQKYGVLGDVSIYILSLVAFVAMCVFVVVLFVEIAGEDIDSAYEITYTKIGLTHTNIVHAWTKRGAKRLFNDGCNKGKIIEIKEID
jgi:Na+/H+-dicarboxylate symporter